MFQSGLKKTATASCSTTDLCESRHIRKDIEAQREISRTTPQSPNGNTEPRV